VLIDRNVLLIGVVLMLGFACYNAVIFSAPVLLMQMTGWTVDSVGYLMAGSGLVNSLLMLAICHHSDQFGSRHLHIAVLLITGAVSALVLWSALAMGLSLVAYLVFAASTLIFGPLCLVLATEVLHPQSRAVGYAAVNTIAQVGNFLGPVLWGAAYDATGSAQMGFSALAPILLVAAALMLLGFARRPGSQGGEVTAA
jgi:ACS family tartrate transporter-like MFS transporter